MNDEFDFDKALKALQSGKAITGKDGVLTPLIKKLTEAALEAGVGFVNAIPVFIASDPEWAQKFIDAGLPIIGDDIKSQVGATITHRQLARLFEDRGVKIDNTYQLNFGGNMDFMNMLERDRLQSKKISKTQSVTSQIEDKINSESVHIGPSDHVPWLSDRKWAYIRLEGTSFGDVPLMAELKLEVWDSPNSAGVIIDAVRCAKLAMDRGMAGPLLAPSSYFMKSPPVQYHDSVAHDNVEAFIDGSGDLAAAQHHPAGSQHARDRRPQAPRHRLHHAHVPLVHAGEVVPAQPRRQVPRGGRGARSGRRARSPRTA